ncbi:glycosyltransferase family 2 protein [Colwellia sp. Arc7-D]|uniref:glycosyltransferase family 2 protein n=1 Tax=Colwellia sp. Arc7-D TaxID=2161872 RepID=UPI000D3C3E3A|nr:glycosyltransferase family 2 protein [Colwellia sp. Arc7-D]AWB56330.1 hypothetical protein DBO93_01250 [Colwellia sp. Arc7-D]
MNISVIIPFFNGFDFFAETLLSIARQTYNVQQIIVINDGGGHEAEEFLSNFNGIKIINLEKNQGPSAARNIAIKLVTSEWIAFCDADDIWQPSKLEQQVKFMSENTIFSACHTGVTTFNQEGDIATFIDKPYDLQLSEAIEISYVTPPSLLIKKSALEQVNYFDTQLKCSEDHDLTIRILEQGYKIGFVNQPLIKVRRMNHGNITSNGRNILKGNLQLFKKNYHIYKRYDGARTLFLYRAFMTAGGKSQGLERKILFTIGKVISLTNPHLR